MTTQPMIPDTQQPTEYTDERIAELRTLAERTHERLQEVIKDGCKFSMHVPAQPNYDYDLLSSRSAWELRKALDEIERLRSLALVFYDPKDVTPSTYGVYFRRDITGTLRVAAGCGRDVTGTRAVLLEDDLLRAFESHLKQKGARDELSNAPKEIIRVYIAAPYSKGDVAVNVRTAIEAGNLIYGLGFVPFIPHLTHFWHLLFPKPYSQWLEYDNHWLPCCDCVWRLPGESNGADAEVLLAKKLGIPVFYSYAELSKAFL